MEENKSSLAESSETVRLYTEPASVGHLGTGIQAANGPSLDTRQPLVQRPAAPISPDHEGNSIRTYKWRWIVLSVFFLNLGINNFVWITAAPVADVMRCYYGISNTWVNTTTTVYMATYIVFFLPCVLFLERYGLKATMVLASVTNALGTAVRVAGTGTMQSSDYSNFQFSYRSQV